MEANSKDIEWFLEHMTQYRIVKETGIAKSKISNLKNGKTKLENLTLRVASELTTFSKGLQKGV